MNIRSLEIQYSALISALIVSVKKLYLQGSARGSVEIEMIIKYDETKSLIIV